LWLPRCWRERHDNRRTKGCGVPRTRIVRQEPGISGDTAVRLAKFFGTTPEFWMNLQGRYEALVAQRAAVGRLRQTRGRKRRS